MKHGVGIFLGCARVWLHLYVSLVAELSQGGGARGGERGADAGAVYTSGVEAGAVCARRNCGRHEVAASTAGIIHGGRLARYIWTFRRCRIAGER